MKAFIIRLKDHTLSEKLSDDCIEQANKFNIKVEKFDAIFGKDYKSHLKQLNIKIHSLVPKQKMSDGHYGNFLSHYNLWLNCITDNTPYLILEHDGYFIRQLPDDILSQFTDVLKLDLFHPYQPEYNQKVNENINQTITFSEIIKGQPNKRKPAGFYSAGAYAYIIKPDACKKLITWININGFLPTDNQLGLDVVNVKQPNVTLVRHHPFFSIDDNILKYSTAKNTYNKYKMNTNENKHKELTQKYSTWGDKLLQHTDVLHSIQYDKKFKPITIQLAPTEVCSSGCPFCSVAERPLKSYLPFVKIKKILEDFKTLGAKSLEITGGGEPLIYIDKETKDDINSIIEYAYQLKYDIGIITNTLKLTKIKPENFDKLNWVRISLIKLDEGYNPEDYNFCNFPSEKLGLSYIIYEEDKGTGTRLDKPYKPTDTDTIKRIAKVIELNPNIKFVRIAGNCLIKGNNASIKEKFKTIIDEIDIHEKIFIKDIGYDDSPFDEGCYVGLIRPYVAPNPHGQGNYQVYICTSHVLNKRNYDLDYSLCDVDNIIPTWNKLNENYKNKNYPYEVKNNCGKDWVDTCKYCYYKFNNKVLHTVAQEMPDKNFP
jgi:GR25 family glycosyltransferase involved in LPS biosynthesis